MELRDRPLVSSEVLELAKIGFKNPRKKLVANLAVGAGISRERIKEILEKIGIDQNARPADVGILEWGKIYGELGK